MMREKCFEVAAAAAPSATSHNIYIESIYIKLFIIIFYAKLDILYSTFAAAARTTFIQFRASLHRTLQIYMHEK